MGAQPKITALKESDLLIPDGEVRGEQLRQVFRRLFSQLNPFFEALSRLGIDITLSQNDRADLITARFVHNKATPIRLKRLQTARSAIVRASQGVPVGVPTVTMQPQQFQGAAPTALVTIAFSGFTPTNGVLTLIELREEGLDLT